MRLQLMIAVLTFGAVNVFGAGYILPNGTILYDGNDQDDSLYKIEQMSKQDETVSQPMTIEQSTPIIHSARPTTIMIEESPIIYERPVVIRERYRYGNPVYDIVDAAGTVLVFGLLYNAVTHGFYHPEFHRHMRHGRYHR